MNSPSAAFLSALIDTAFGPVELRRDATEKLTSVRLMPGDSSRTNSSLPDSFGGLSLAIVDYFNGKAVDFQPFLNLAAPVATTEFRQRVYAYVATIPYGQRESYADVAAAVGSPRAMRAVGGAMAANPIPLIVPCHRVVSATGLGGFSAGCGVELKRRMLELEGLCI